MSQIAVLWRPSDNVGPGNKALKEAGGEANLSQRWECCQEVETTCSTLDYSGKTSGRLQQSEPQGKCNNEVKGVTTKRKVGRPIAYQGEPDSPDLEPEQRQIILRRIANRRSAQRGRERRQNEIDNLAKRNLETEASNTALKAKARASELKERTTCRELEQLKECVRELTVKNGRMQHDIARLTSALAERRQARLLVSDHTTIRGSAAPALLSVPPIPMLSSTFVSVPEGPLPPGHALDLPQPFSTLPVSSLPFAGELPLPYMPEHFLQELLHMIY
ncbi:g9556 [Coccomyxa viridis]|uniref:G9556 protein n=1 Tax=Coccomyxa viridis TaxID=1274662 RepID=A0ABP1G5S0_9CHLO